jgi:hypothetical protein
MRMDRNYKRQKNGWLEPWKLEVGKQRAASRSRLLHHVDTTCYCIRTCAKTAKLSSCVDSISLPIVLTAPIIQLEPSYNFTALTKAKRLQLGKFVVGDCSTLRLVEFMKAILVKT